MTEGKTTRQILQEKETSGNSVPLYNPAALEKIKKDFDGWLKETVATADRENWTATPHNILGSELPRELIYSPLSNPGFDYLGRLAFSGQEPYTRGLHPNMYRGRTFTMRQLSGAGAPEYINRRLKMLLGHGATGMIQPLYR